MMSDASHIVTATGRSDRPARDHVTRILIVDDNQLTSLGLRSMVESAPAMAVCGSTERGSPAVLEVAASDPDVVVLCVAQCEDEYLGDVAALSSMVPVLLVATKDDGVLAALRHGAAGCLMYEDATHERLVSAVVAVASGQAYLSSSLLRSVLSRADAAPTDAGADEVDLVQSLRAERSLTQRECEVMDLVSIGLGNEEIAARLFLSQKTVRNYLSHAYAALGASSRTQAALAWQTSADPMVKTPA